MLQNSKINCRISAVYIDVKHEIFAALFKCENTIACLLGKRVRDSIFLYFFLKKQNTNFLLCYICYYHLTGAVSSQCISQFNLSLFLQIGHFKQQGESWHGAQVNNLDLNVDSSRQRQFHQPGLLSQLVCTGNIREMENAEEKRQRLFVERGR